jgi:hypothetical protein
MLRKPVLERLNMVRPAVETSKAIFNRNRRRWMRRTRNQSARRSKQQELFISSERSLMADVPRGCASF